MSFLPDGTTNGRSWFGSLVGSGIAHGLILAAAIVLVSDADGALAPEEGQIVDWVAPPEDSDLTGSVREPQVADGGEDPAIATPPPLSVEPSFASPPNIPSDPPLGSELAAPSSSFPVGEGVEGRVDTNAGPRLPDEREVASTPFAGESIAGADVPVVTESSNILESSNNASDVMTSEGPAVRGDTGVEVSGGTEVGLVERGQEDSVVAGGSAEPSGGGAVLADPQQLAGLARPLSDTGPLPPPLAGQGAASGTQLPSGTRSEPGLDVATQPPISDVGDDVPINNGAAPDVSQDEAGGVSLSDGPRIETAEGPEISAAVEREGIESLQQPTAQQREVAELLAAVRSAQTSAPSCGLALPRVDSDGNVALALFGDEDDTVAAYRTAIGTLPPTTALRETRVSEPQCAVMDALRTQVQGYPATRIGIALEDVRLESGGVLEGRFTGAGGRAVTTLLVDEAGVTQDLRDFMDVEGQDITLFVPVTRTTPAGQPVDRAQLLLVLSNPPDAPLIIGALDGGSAVDVIAGMGSLSNAHFGLIPFIVR